MYNLHLSCEKGHLEVAKWLCTLDKKYYLVIVDDVIKNYGIKDNLAYNAITNDKLIEAYYLLEIKNGGEINDKETCLICHDEPESIVMLPCSHYYCLESLVIFYKTNNINDKKCSYCTKGFDWEKCIWFNKKNDLLVLP